MKTPDVLIILWLVGAVLAYIVRIAYAGDAVKRYDSGDHGYSVAFAFMWPVWVLTIPYWLGRGLGNVCRFINRMEW